MPEERFYVLNCGEEVWVHSGSAPDLTSKRGQRRTKIRGVHRTAALAAVQVATMVLYAGAVERKEGAVSTNG